MKSAVFAGSFDPFTNGHLDIVKKAAALFDKVYVVIGVNINKKRLIPADKMLSSVEKVFAREGLNNCSISIYDGLIVDFARENNAGFIVRGLRNASDFTYEEEMASVNTMLSPETEYVYFRANDSVLSSSMVRELLCFGKDVSRFLPKEVYQLTEELSE